ncbi:MAG TPA: hypothetical protein VJN93_15365 [Candidatus Acidoferrum sp.]|nr:hypothetical protein [Candidatus Acidoferrum sp.]
MALGEFETIVVGKQNISESALRRPWPTQLASKILTHISALF